MRHIGQTAPSELFATFGCFYRLISTNLAREGRQTQHSSNRKRGTVTMKRTRLLIVVLFGISVAFGSGAAAQTPQPSPADKAPSETDTLSPKTVKSPDTSSGAAGGEVEALMQRVQELEKQNRAMAQMLSEVRAKLENMSRSGAASAVAPAAPASPSGPSTQNSVQSNQRDEGGNVRWSELIGEGNKIKLYGFLRLDMIFDSQQP